MATSENTKKPNRTDRENFDFLAKRIELNALKKLTNQDDQTLLQVQVEQGEKVGNQMAFWPDAVAAMPTELTRVSLFGMPSDKRGARKMFDDAKLDGRNDIDIRYTGKQLCSKDETTWLACLRLGRDVKMGDRIPMKKSDLLKECGLSKTGPNWSTLEKRLDRLSKASFVINFKRNLRNFHITTGMLKWGMEEETELMYIRLDPDGATLFNNLSYQPWQIRLSLKTDVAALLLSYISGHEQGKLHSQQIENLKKWCGYSGELRKFRTSCIAALSELEDKGVLVKGSVKLSSNGSVVYWTRTRAEKSPAP